MEILLVVATIGILAGVVILALNPNKQLGETRNAQRRQDVATILNAVYQYAIDNGELPDAVTGSQTEICQTDASSCTGLIDLSALTDDELYLTAIPEDPTEASTNGTGYEIFSSGNDRVTVVAPGAERSVTIRVTR